MCNQRTHKMLYQRFSKIMWVSKSLIDIDNDLLNWVLNDSSSQWFRAGWTIDWVIDLKKE